MNFFCKTFMLISFTCLFFACSFEKRKKNTEITSDTLKLQKVDDFFLNENKSVNGIKFKVDNVLKNDTLLETFPAKKVLANFIRKQITYYPESNDTLLKLVPISGNGLINTINICYGQHRPLVLSPDVIWMTIAQGVSTHINKEFKQLDVKLFKKNKPKVIKVRNDSLEYGVKHWKSLITSLTNSTKKYTKEDMFSFLAPKFSTTTENIHIAYQANILYGYKKAFTYVGEGGCGIPYITLTGTKSDWIKIKESLSNLDDLELGFWRKELELILDEFIAIYTNTINEKFWRNIYKEYLDYGEFSISGWIIKLYPYIEVLGTGVYDKELGMMKVEHKFLKNEYVVGDKYLYSKLNIDVFPNYKSEANIIWENHLKNERTKLFLYSGIMGAKQYVDGSLMPWVTWAISKENEKEPALLRSQSNEVIHRDPKWIPHIYENDSTVIQKAIYPIKKDFQFEEGLTHFRKQVSKIVYPNYSQKGDTLTFYILSNGKPIIITDNKKLELKVQTWLNEKGVKWNPAKVKLSEAVMFKEEVDSTKLVSVNSKIKIVIEKN
ncbi:DUF4419 domain-containing protein [Tenacibaculum halocynthiae]|uniref:DUF4419 domain-containing protein n=1 Tax=Tenacibaculum halocynthiae TaxID=1254437 RepID=UPI0038B47503